MSYQFVYPSNFEGKQRAKFSLTPQKPTVQMRREFNDYMYLYNSRVQEYFDSVKDKPEHEKTYLFVEFMTEENIKMAAFICDTTGFTVEELEYLKSDVKSEFWSIQNYEEIEKFTSNFRKSSGFTG